MAGYQVTALADARAVRTRQNINIKTKIIELFGQSGVLAGAAFLMNLATDVEVRNSIAHVRVYVWLTRQG